MPVYNCANYVAEAICSVLRQTFGEFDLFIVDDGSTDETWEVVRRLAASDRRICASTQPNKGMGATLNDMLFGIEHSYIARMDGDDICEQDRFEQQLRVLAHQSRLGVLAGYAYLISSSGKCIGVTGKGLECYEKVQEAYQRQRALGLCHPSVVGRRRAFVDCGGYRPRFWPADDVDLWNRIFEANWELRTLPRPVVRYRIHGGSVSVAKARVAYRKLQWVKACTWARRQGKPEPTWEEFRQAYAREGWSRQRKELAWVAYKMAAVSFAEGRRLRSVAAGALGALLVPGGVVAKLGKLRRD